jgi:DNA-binding winged helix-turn-helix (wHTH) protein
VNRRGDRGRQPGGARRSRHYKEFELLKYLAQHAGRVFTRAQLLQEVWGYDFFGGTRTVDVHVRRLRAKLGTEHEQMIGTVRNVGYKFVRPPARASRSRRRPAGRHQDARRPALGPPQRSSGTRPPGLIPDRECGPPAATQAAGRPAERRWLRTGPSPRRRPDSAHRTPTRDKCSSRLVGPSPRACLSRRPRPSQHRGR